MAAATSIAAHQAQMVWERGADAVAREVLSEIEAVQNSFPGRGVAIGYGRNDSYAVGNLQCLPRPAGPAYLLDSDALMLPARGR